MNFMDTIPDEMIIAIANHLPPISQARFHSCCSRFWILRNSLHYSDVNTYRSLFIKNQINKILALSTEKTHSDVFRHFLFCRGAVRSAIFHAAFYRSCIKGNSFFIRLCQLVTDKANPVGMCIVREEKNGVPFDIFEGTQEPQNWADSGFMTSVLAEDRELVEYFMRKGAKDFNEGLMAVSITGDVELAKLLLEHGANDLDIALRAAARYGRTEVMELLIEKGASNFVSALGDALNENSEKAVKLLEPKIKHWNFTLTQAVVWQNLKLAEFAIQKDACVLKATIGFAMQQNNEITKLVINNMTDYFACYAICKAILHNHVDLAEEIYQQRMPALCDGLETAAKQGNKKAVDWFIAKGATQWKYGLRGAGEGGRKDLAIFFMLKGATNLYEAWDKAAQKKKSRRERNKDTARWREFIQFAKEIKNEMTWQEWIFNYVLTADAGKELFEWISRSWTIFLMVMIAYIFFVKEG